MILPHVGILVKITQGEAPTICVFGVTRGGALAWFLYFLHFVGKLTKACRPYGGFSLEKWQDQPIHSYS